MRSLIILTSSVVLLTITSTVEAQCNRGGGRAASTLSPSANFNNSPLASSFVPSARDQLLAMQYRQAQALQYQSLQAQRQRNMQLLAQRSRQNQRRQTNADRSMTSASDSRLAGNSNRRQQQLRQQNAAKALRLAAKAEAKGRMSTAEDNYQRVIRIVGRDSAMGREAIDALAALESQTRTPTVVDRSTDTMLVSAKTL